jgi:hypothetical protein
MSSKTIQNVGTNLFFYELIGPSQRKRFRKIKLFHHIQHNNLCILTTLEYNMIVHYIAYVCKLQAKVLKYQNHLNYFRTLF